MTSSRNRTTLFRTLASLAFFGGAAALSTTPAAEAQVVNVRTDRIVSGLTFPVFVTHAPGDASRLFIVQKGGIIRIFNLETQALLTTPFVTVTGIVGGTSETSEQGLLGLAFDPNYAKNGQFYVYLTGSGTNLIRRYTRSASDPNIANASSAVTVLSWSDPFSNHNGGWMGFGPDGNLYVGTGDGGSGNDPNNAGQTITNQRNGKMLRIKPNTSASAPYYTVPAGNPFVGVTGDDEIWAYGLRNPWRCSFDRLTGDLWIADVGQNAVEEVNFQPAGELGGRNYGWRCMEGTSCTGLSGCTCNGAALTMPIRTYGHNTSGGYSITGGYVYRGCAIDGLQGTYFYADYVSNNSWSFRYNGSTVTDFTTRNSQFTPSLDGFTLNQISSFGEDANGELYVVDQGSSASQGAIFKIVPSTGDRVCPPPCAAADLDCNGTVDANDLAALLANWGGTGTGDIDDNGTVDSLDLAALLAAWN